MAFLQGPSAKQLEVIKQELGEGPGDVERAVRDLLDLCAASPHLPRPEALDPRFLELFVRGCRMDTERARAKFEAFCVSRARHRDLYEHRSLSEPPLQDVAQFIDIVPLPRLTDEGLRVTLFRIRAGYDGDACDVAATVRAVLLVCDARMHDERAIAGDVFVWEVSAVRASIVAHVASAFSTIRRGIHLAHAAYPQRLKRNHIVGAPAFFASTLQLMRSCMNAKVKRRFYLHPKVEDLLEHIPARVLPVECGGQEESLEVLARRWRLRVDELRDHLRSLNDIGDIPQHAPPDHDMYGAVGAFRKLDID